MNIIRCVTPGFRFPLEYVSNLTKVFTGLGVKIIFGYFFEIFPQSKLKFSLWYPSSTAPAYGK